MLGPALGAAGPPGPLVPGDEPARDLGSAPARGSATCWQLDEAVRRRDPHREDAISLARSLLT